MPEVTEFGVAWLSAASERPRQFRAAWRKRPYEPMLVPTGRLFDLLTVDESIGLEAVDLLRRDRHELAPAFQDRAVNKVGFLVLVGALPLVQRTLHRNPYGDQLAYGYVGPGGYLVVPALAARPAARFTWLEPPTGLSRNGLGQLVPLVDALVIAAFNVRLAAEYGERHPSVMGAAESR